MLKIFICQCNDGRVRIREEPGLGCRMYLARYVHANSEEDGMSDLTGSLLQYDGPGVRGHALRKSWATGTFGTRRGSLRRLLVPAATPRNHVNAIEKREGQAGEMGAVQVLLVQ